MDVLTTAQGVDRDWQITLRDSSGNIVNTFLDADTPTAVVWVGDNQAATFTPTASWIDVGQGTVKLSVSASATASVTPAKYPIRLKITRASDSKVFDAWQGLLQIEATVGTATALSVYGTLADAVVYAPWIQDLQGDLDEAAFTRHFHDARCWLENIIQKKYPGSVRQCHDIGATRFLPYYQDDPGGHNLWLQQQLDANKLMINDPRRVKEITAKRAIGTICRAAVGPGRGSKEYMELGYAFLRESNSLVSCYTAEIDLQADGIADIRINCGQMSVRMY